MMRCAKKYVEKCACALFRKCFTLTGDDGNMALMTSHEFPIVFQQYQFDGGSTKRYSAAAAVNEPSSASSRSRSHRPPQLHHSHGDLMETSFHHSHEFASSYGLDAAYQISSKSPLTPPSKLLSSIEINT